MKKAFTLAEIMIVLVVIGVLAGILVPVANNTRPDENVMKFKKANAALGTVVRELVNSGKYFKAGDLGLLSDGTNANKSSFCLAFADVIGAKKKNCDYTTDTNQGYVSACSHVGGVCNEKVDFYELTGFDNGCKVAENKFKGDVLGILTQDNIYYFEQNLNNTFGCIYKGTTNSCAVAGDSGWNGQIGTRLFGYGSQLDYKPFDSGIKALRFYRIFCIDIDGINQGEDPFGYGIRVDGKILAGARAQEWIEKGIQRGANDN